MTTMLNKISTMLCEQIIDFDLSNQYVWCLAHIINLAVQKSLKNLHTSEPENENSLNNDEETENKLKNVIYKVSLYFIILEVLTFNLIFNY